MTEEEKDGNMAECGACREVVPIDSSACPKCGVSFGGVSDEPLGACGACGGLATLDAKKCPHCGVSFVADNVLEVLGDWLTATGLDVRALFERFDENDDGVISAFEFKKGLLALNIADLPPAQIDRLIETLDEDGDGSIDLSELENTFSGGNAPTKEVGKEVAKDTKDDSAKEEDSAAAKEEDPKTDEEEDSDDEVPDEDEDSDEEDTSDDADASDDDDDKEEEKSDSKDTSSDDDDDSDEDDDSDDETEDDEPDQMEAFKRLGHAIADSGMTIREVFEKMDTNDDRRIDGPELQKGIKELGGESLSPQDIFVILGALDEDDDGRLDPMELVDALEELDLDIESDVVEESKEVKEVEFPTEQQKMLMSKKWNDVWWPIIHVGFAIIAVVWLANGLVGPVDGTGGNVAFDGDVETWSPNNGIMVEPGDSYSCDIEIQVSKCANSLTPLAGDSSSMPVGFYWDGILFLLFGLFGLGGSLFMQYSVVKGWRVKAKALKSDDDDTEDSDDDDTEDSDDDDDDSDDDDDDDSDDDDDDDSDDDDDDDSDDDDDDSDDDDDDSDDDDESDDDDDESDDDDDDDSDDEIDLGSRIGIEIDGIDVFGKIISFDDDADTVTIEDEDTGEEVEGPQEDMFIE